MVNKERRTIEAGEQVFYNYGDHTNRYLLVQYGFCFPNNKYDTYELRMKIDLSIEQHELTELVDFTFKYLSV